MNPVEEVNKITTTNDIRDFPQINFNKLIIWDYDAEKTIFECPEPKAKPYVWQDPVDDDSLRCFMNCLCKMVTHNDDPNIPNNFMIVTPRSFDDVVFRFPSANDVNRAARELSSYLNRPVACTCDSRDKMAAVIFTSKRMYMNVDKMGFSEFGFLGHESGDTESEDH